MSHSDSKYISIPMEGIASPLTQSTVEHWNLATSVVPPHPTYLPEKRQNLRAHETNANEFPSGRVRTEPERDQDRPAADTTKQWKKCLNTISDANQVIIGGWVEDIDTLLVLSGLVAATVTAFNIDSYKWLQQDSGDVHTFLLVHISAQLANGTLPPAVIPTFEPSASTIRINALWFISLVLSLSVALIGMVTKGWLRHYLNSPQSSSHESAQIRQYRHDSLTKWSIPQIIPWLPLFLQLSLLCFLIGLLDLLLSLNKTVATAAAVAMAVPFSFLAITALLSLFFDDYPSPSPHGTIFMQLILLLIYAVTHILLLPIKETKEIRRLIGQFVSRVWVLREGTEIAQKSEVLEHHMLIEAAVANDEFMDVVRTRMRNISTSVALDCLYQIVLRRWALVAFVNVPMYIVREVAVVMGLAKDILSRDVAPADDFRVSDVLQLLYEGWSELPREGSDGYQEAEPVYQEAFSMLAKLLSVYGGDVQLEAFVQFQLLYERSSVSANPRILEQLIASRGNIHNDVSTISIETLVLKIATKYPSSSVTVVDQLAREIEWRSGVLDPGLVDALRDFRASEATLSRDSPAPNEPVPMHELPLLASRDEGA